MIDFPTTPTNALLPEAVSQRIDELAAQFTDRVALSGLAVLGAAPDALPEAERVARCLHAGRAALETLARRVNAATAEDVDVGVFVLGLMPRLFCIPEADAPALVPADVARFAVTVLGRNLLARVDVSPDLLPPSWRDCLTAVTRASTRLGAKRADAACVAVTRLALLALAYGVRTATGIPATVRLSAWARAAGWGTRVIRDWKRGLRVAHGCLAARVPAEGGNGADAVVWPDIAAESPHTLRVALRQVGVSFADLEAAARNVEGGAEALRSAARLARSLRFGRADTAMVHGLAVVAPQFVPLLSAPRAPQRGRPRSRAVRPKTARGVLRAIDRLLAEYVTLHEAAPPRDLTPADLLTTRVPAAGLRVPLAQEVGRSWVEANLRRSVDPLTVPLWHLLLDRQVEASAAHSPIVRARPAGEPIAFTYTIGKSAKDLGHALARAVHASTVAGSEARRELERLVATADEVTTFIMGHLLHDPDVAALKDVAAFLRLATWPQLVVVGMRYLRARVWELRRELSAHPTFGAPEPDMAVYLGWLECYIVFATLCADPLRSQNWRHAWMGENLLLSLDRSGAEPRIVAAQSHFTGNGGVNPDSALKQVDEARRDARGNVNYALRVRVHRWAPDIVDFDLLYDYLTLVRAPRLPRTKDGRTPDFVDELRPGSLRHPLFVAPEGSGAADALSEDVVESDGAPADAADLQRARPMSESMFRSRFARALHFICRDVLGRPLPEWDVFKDEHGALLAFLFGPHILRSACATYWLLVRRGGEVGDALDAAERDALRAAAARDGVPAVLGVRTAPYVGELLNDHIRTLRERYVAWPTDLAARMLEPCRDWEHPRAFDREMDRLAAGVGMSGQHDVDLPLPLGCSVDDLAVRSRNTPRSIRIKPRRRARNRDRA